MNIKILTNRKIKHSKEHFSKQYGIDELEKIRIETMNSYAVMKYYVSLENKFFPSSNGIMKAATKVDYINKKTNFDFPSNSGIEKKVDYLHICTFLILENWLLNLLPKQVQNPIELAKKMGNEETGWIIAANLLTDIFKKCDELEENYNQNN